MRKKEITVEGGQAIVEVYKTEVIVKYKDNMPVNFERIRLIEELQQQNQLEKVIKIFKIEEAKRQVRLEKADMTLKFFLENSKELLISEKIELMIQISRGLQELHSFNFLHRDIKEDNILILNGQIKIGDLGTIKILGQDKLYSRIGAPNGAPELLDPVYGFPSDIYSLGLLFFFILTKTRLANRGALEQNQIAIIKKFQLLAKEVEEQIYILIRQMINHNPNERILLDVVIQTLNNLKTELETQVIIIN